MSEYKATEIEREGSLAMVSLNRPEVLNAVNMQMYDEIPRLFDQLSDDDEIRAIILMGNGRAFSVGADLKERQTMSVSDIQRRRRLAPSMFGSVANCRKPVIAAIHGYALGGGLELALSCDIIIAATSTQMALPETAIGVIPGGGATQRVPRLVGPQMAKELIFTGRRFSATEARDMGLIGHVVEEEDLLGEALSLARDIMSSAPIAVYQAKKAINASMSLDMESGLRFETEAYQTCLATEDRKEGVAAFGEKRTPRFTGK